MVFYFALRTLSDYCPSLALEERQVFDNCAHIEVLAGKIEMVEFDTNADVDNLNDSHNEALGDLDLFDYNENLVPDTFAHKVTPGVSFALVEQEKILLDEVVYREAQTDVAGDEHIVVKIVGDGHNLASVGDSVHSDVGEDDWDDVVDDSVDAGAVVLAHTAVFPGPKLL